MQFFSLFLWSIGFYIYIYTALCLQNLAKKKNTGDECLAWVPIANLYLVCKIAKRPDWWIFLLFTPFAGAVIYIVLWMDIAEICNKPAWWGPLMIIPMVNLVVMGRLAFGD